jgi:hypothetical protein
MDAVIVYWLMVVDPIVLYRKYVFLFKFIDFYQISYFIKHACKKSFAVGDKFGT